MGDDSIGQYDYHEDPWRDIRGVGLAPYSTESTNLGSKDTYPLPKFDSLSTSSEPLRPSKRSFQPALLSSVVRELAGATVGVSVAAGSVGALFWQDASTNAVMSRVNS